MTNELNRNGERLSDRMAESFRIHMSINSPTADLRHQARDYLRSKAPLTAEGRAEYRRRVAERRARGRAEIQTVLG